MGETGPQPRIVQALHDYKGQNNDELCLLKGDMITVTQALDGGWWEGTLREETGWFPSNYVKEVKDNRMSLKAGSDLSKSRRDSMVHYHSVVLQNIIETERTYVEDLKSLLQTHLRPLNATNVLTASEFSHLCGNLEELTTLHESLLAALEDCTKEPLHQQRVGGIFLKTAPTLRGVYRVYCSNHPRAVTVVQSKKDDLSKFMESRGSPPPGVMTLTTSLATPFTRLDKYPLLLKELERHTDESHIDRGDTQRAICVYKDIANVSIEVRKLKELEYDIMGCDISGWEGEPLSSLGDVLHLSHVQVQCDNTESRDRLLLLFPGLLVILSVSPRLSGYTYQGKLPTSGLTVKSLEDTDSSTNAFELSGSMVDQRIVSCLTSQIRAEWIELLQQQAKLGPTRRISVKPQSLQVTSAQPSISTLSHAQTAYAVHQPYRSCRTTWSMSCLRPCPPLRPAFYHKDEGQRSPRTGRRILGGGRRKAERSHSEDEPIKYKKIGDCKTLEDDAYILKVIEAYCTSARARQTVNSLDLTKIRQNWNTCVLLDSPQILIAEEEKIIVEEMKGNETIVEEKSLVDTVYSLKDQVHDLKQEQGKLRRDLEEEKRARKRLEVLIRKSLKSMVVEPIVLVSAATTDESTT